jgi:hypothetical protein
MNRVPKSLHLSPSTVIGLSGFLAGMALGRMRKRTAKPSCAQEFVRETPPHHALEGSAFSLVKAAVDREDESRIGEVSSV